VKFGFLTNSFYRANSRTNRVNGLKQFTNVPQNEVSWTKCGYSNVQTTVPGHETGCPNPLVHVVITNVTTPFVHAKEEEAMVLPVSMFLSESVHDNNQQNNNNNN